MITIDKLNNFGANTAEGLERCLGNESFYLRLVSTFVNESNFDKLKDALAINDLNAAFEAAHALKGVLGNLSLTPLYNKVVEITELLRSRTKMNYSQLLAQILEKRETLKEMCK